MFLLGVAVVLYLVAIWYSYTGCPKNPKTIEMGQLTAEQQIFEEGREGVKWELGFAYFWVGKWDFMHWDWDSSAKKNNRKWEWD